MKKVINKVPGIILALIIAVPAWLLGNAFPIIGSPVLGILFGMILAFWKRPSYYNEGITYTAKKLLQYSIIFMGFGMNLFNVFKVGKQTIILMMFTLTAAFITAYIVGKLLKINGKTAALIGVGSSICGGSAIAATAPVIDASEQEVAHSISTIFLFNAVAAFLFPFLGHLFGMSDQCFGLWAGTAVNDTSSVVAAGYSYSTAAGNLAVIVKLTRTLAIVPITLALAIYTSKKEAKSKQGSYSIGKIFPWFVLGFAAASVISTFIPLPVMFVNFLAQAGKFVIVMAMVSVGLNTNIVELIKNGVRPILLGFTCWVVLAITSLGIQHFVMRIF
ncbi:YeiH family putative sulfate export transporter [Clostridium sp. P21]|uniref:YeiH family putative sulfate export transporter n=1 Tax=Clostridium muellerianum TaxID=2716538 RepID=A0A7Y0HPE7_9CLOT|nr:YeiH family protein [Clostridium muellerianum]NMM62613.1 YeiH family putative sulfate export transporter [Clostridium muellerianum]